MKKKSIIIAFSMLILVTIIAFGWMSMEAYRYEMDPANGVDILEGFAAFLLAAVGGFAVLYEIDLFYTTYYFCIKRKTMAKTLLNVFANLSFLLAFVSVYLSNLHMELRKYELLPVLFFFGYLLLRMVYFFVSIAGAEKTADA